MLTLTVHKMYQELDSQGNLIYAFLQCLKTPLVTMHILADGYSIGGWLMVTVGQLAESIGATLAPELVQQSVGALQCSTSLRSSTSLTISLYTVLLLLQSGQLSHSINTSKSSPLSLLLLCHHCPALSSSQQRACLSNGSHLPSYSPIQLNLRLAFPLI